MAEQEKPKTPKPDKDGNVLVNADALNKLIEGYEALKDRVSRVETAADVNRLDNFDAKHRKPGPRQYLLTIYRDPESNEGKLVTGWRTIVDRKWMERGVLMSEQRYEIIFTDAEGKLSKLQVDGYENFANVRHGFRVVGEFMQEKSDNSGITLTLKILGVKDPENTVGPDLEAAQKWFGKEVEINLNFVN